MLESKVHETVTRPRGVQQIAEDHGVEVETLQRYLLAREHHRHEFQVMCDLEHDRILDR